MNTKGKNIIFMVLLALTLVISGCSNDSSNAVKGTAQGGGELRIAIDAQPPTLDQPSSNATAARDTSRLIFETLLTTNSKMQAVPMLAESIDVSEDGKTYTFHLRKGVKFHNDKEMIAEDVIASMYRWLEVSPLTGTIFNDATFEAKDDYTVVLQLVNPSGLTLDTMASAKQSPAIMPKEIIDAATSVGVPEYIGTGPYKLVEWKQDQYIHFTKFDDYQSVESEADGLAGKKEALVDDIYFDIVTDASTRMAGLQTGQYDVAYSLPYDNYERLENDSNVNPSLVASGELIIVYNKNTGPTSNFKMRQAINTAVNVDEIMMGAFPYENLYWLSPSYMSKSIENWASDAGGEFFNLNDMNKAKEILNEIGYNNEEVKIITTRDYTAFYDAAVILQDQLKELGLNVTLEVYDWPTHTTKMNNEPDSWDLFVVGSSTVTVPSQLVALSTTFAGGVGDPDVPIFMKAIETSSSQEEAKQLWDELQAYSWREHLPITVLGGYNNLFGESVKLEGLIDASGPVFWNTEVVK